MGVLACVFDPKTQPGLPCYELIILRLKVHTEENPKAAAAKDRAGEFEVADEFLEPELRV